MRGHLAPENTLTGNIIDAALTVHKTLGGPGLLESIYEEALALELKQRGLRVDCQKAIPVYYKNVPLSTALRLDMLIEDRVIVECQAVRELHPVFLAQTLTYLRVTGLHLALLINFGEKLLKHGIHRVINGSTAGD
ncbi:MAG: GxxExxY protein [Anaerolineae bacterium]|jgi:GxxExxY protein|nr:GxxExxY protein [Anaerolineae bacterium]